MKPALIVAFEDLVAGLAGDIELSTKHRHLVAVEQTGNEFKPLIHKITLLPRHFALLAKGQKCNLCVQNKVSPISREAHNEINIIITL